MRVEQEFPRWIRTGHTPRRADFGPEFQDDWRFCRHSMYPDRRKVIRRFGFALPCHEAIKALMKISPLVEVGAGTGAWAAILAANGADIIATDREFVTGYGFHAGRYHPVARMSADNAVRRYPDRNVLMIWPCYGSEWPTKTVRLIKPGKYLALVSEGEGGCVAADSLFCHLGKYFRHISEVRIPCWDGIHDRMDIYQRKIGAPPSSLSCF